MSFDPSKRARFGTLKVRTGCLNCKAKHLKCDEAQPSCRRCVKSGRSCQRPQSGRGELRMVHYVPGQAQSLTLWPDLNKEEQRLFHEFNTRAGPELAGVHNPEFWLRYVVHIGTADPAIKHAIIGLTALHEQYCSGTKSGAMNQDAVYALREYTKSISILTRSMKAGSMAFPDTPLVACVLYCAFESMSHHLHSAFSHVGSGIKIFLERKDSVQSPRQNSIPFYILNQLYTRLDIQCLEIGETTFDRQSEVQTLFTTRIESFQGIDNLQATFDDLMNAIIHAIYDIDRTKSYNAHHSSTTNSTAKAVLKNLTHRFSEWCNVFDTFVAGPAAASHLAACLLLQVSRILLLINLHVNLRDGEMDFDRFGTEFQSIVDLCLAFALTQSKLRTNVRPPDSALAGDIGTPLIEKHHVCRSTNDSGQRGGYLGIDSRCTPFVSTGTFDMERVHTTTEHLLGTYRRQIATFLGKAKDTSILSHDLEPSYCFSPGIVSPLYVTISRCRDPFIRREALALMQRCKRREGLWDSDLAGHLGQRVIEIEEHRTKELNSMTFESSTAFGEISNITSSGQIPNQARIRMVKPTFLPDRRSIERYYFGLPVTHCYSDSVEETWIEEIIEW